MRDSHRNEAPHTKLWRALGSPGEGLSWRIRAWIGERGGGLGRGPERAGRGHAAADVDFCGFDGGGGEGEGTKLLTPLPLPRTSKKNQESHEIRETEEKKHEH